MEFIRLSMIKGNIHEAQWRVLVWYGKWKLVRAKEIVLYFFLKIGAQESVER